MKGIITIADIQGIMDEFGLALAIKATYWSGTFLGLLVNEGII
jgi:hypothetical protein